MDLSYVVLNFFFKFGREDCDVSVLEVIQFQKNSIDLFDDIRDEAYNILTLSLPYVHMGCG